MGKGAGHAISLTPERLSAVPTRASFAYGASAYLLARVGADRVGTVIFA